MSQPFLISKITRYEHLKNSGEGVYSSQFLKKKQPNLWKLIYKFILTGGKL